MNKLFKKYLGYWVVLLVLFNVIAFVSVGWANHEKYTASFWIGYVFISLCFIGQLACAHKALREDNLTKLFYNIPILKTSYSGLIASFVFGGLCMLISPLPYWVGVILCAIILAINVIAVMKATVAAETVTDIDKKVKVQTFFIKSLTVDAETLMARAENEDMKAECKKVYDALRFSDPMSNEALAATESQITLRFSALTDAVSSGELAAVQSVARELVILVEDRNKKCRLLK